MIFYQTKYQGGGENRICWQGTQADATAKRKALKEEDCSNITTETVEVPVDKPSLLIWLNTNCTGE